MCCVCVEDTVEITRTEKKQKHFLKFDINICFESRVFHYMHYYYLHILWYVRLVFIYQHMLVIDVVQHENNK